MEKKVLVICGTVGFLGLLSAALGFAAEATRVKASDVLTRIPGECTYPQSPALCLALASVIAVVMAQAIMSTVAECICCKRNTNPANTNWNVALISFVVSWVTFITAFLLLLTGAVVSGRRGEQKMYSGDSCYVVKPGVFSGGAVLSLASVSLGILYFVSFQKSKNSESWDPTHNQGIALGQPQIHPHSTQPVFIHENTYNRQQIP